VTGLTIRRPIQPFLHKARVGQKDRRTRLCHN